MALNTPLSHPGLSQRLWHAYASLPDVGSLEQFYLAMAVQHLFRLNALETTGGNFTNALLQGLLTCLLSEADDWDRQWDFQSFWTAWRAGLTRSEIRQWISILGYEGPCEVLAETRRLNLLSNQGLKARLKDLDDDDPTHKILDYSSIEDLVRKITGTVHTGYLKDLRLAQKMASVIDRSHNLPKVVLPEIPAGDLNDPDIWLAYLEKINSPQIQRFLKDSKYFEIRIRNPEDFDREVGKPADPTRAIEAYFRQSLLPGGRDIIWIRAFPDSSPSLAKITTRCAKLIHEWEHWRHFSGDREMSIHPMREEKIIAEMMSLLEEHLLYLSFGFHHFDSIAHWLGVPLGLFLRDFSDLKGLS